LADLVSKSWLECCADRYSLLLPVSRWSASQLGAEAADLRSRHLAYMHRLAKSRVIAIGGRRNVGDAQRRDALTELDEQKLDFWSALTHAGTVPDAAREISLVLALWPYWSIRGLFVEARHYIAHALSRPITDGPEIATL